MTASDCSRTNPLSDFSKTQAKTTMDVTSTYKFARISARKARDVAREIQGLPVSEALDILNFTPRKAAFLF